MFIRFPLSYFLMKRNKTERNVLLVQFLLQEEQIINSIWPVIIALLLSALTIKHGIVTIPILGLNLTQKKVDMLVV